MDSDLSIEAIAVEDIVRTGVSHSLAQIFHDQLQSILAEVGHSRPSTWHRISQQQLKPEHPHALHQLMYYSTYRQWDTATHGPPLAWFPTPEIASETNLGRILEAKGYELLGSTYRSPLESYSDLQRLSVEQPEKYFPVLFESQSIVFHQQPQCILDKSNPALPGGQWLPGAVLNVAESCLAAKGTKTDSSPAIVWRNEGEDEMPLRVKTLSQLRADVSQVANALEALGFQKGDAIAIDMPMNVYAVTAYLAIILGGFVVVSIADSFVASEIATRVRVAKAKGIFTQDVILRGGKKIPLYSRVVEARAPRAIVVPADERSLNVQLRKGDVSWTDFLAKTNQLSRPNEYKAVALPIEAYSNILFSSGTTGEPKAIPWTHATPLRCAADSWAHNDMRSGDVGCQPTNLGWMMGPFIIFGTLPNGATLALYNGSPLGRGFGQFIQDARVTMLGTVPSLVKAWKATGCMANLDWSAIRSFGSTGETSSADDDLWLSGRAGYKPVLEACGGTELGAQYLGGCVMQPQALAAFSTPSMSMKFVILDEAGKPYAEDELCIGELALVPFSFGASSTLLNADHDKIYFKGMPVHNGRQLRRHGDIFQRLPGGYYKAYGRSDDTMNLGGIKASAVEIEQVCNKAHDCLLETAAIAVQPPGGGPEELVIAVVLKEGTAISSNELKKIFSSTLMCNLNPLFKVSAVAVVSEFPRTASNKLLRRVLRTQFSRNPLQSRL